MQNHQKVCSETRSKTSFTHYLIDVRHLLKSRMYYAFSALAVCYKLISEIRFLKILLTSWMNWFTGWLICKRFFLNDDRLKIKRSNQLDFCFEKLQIDINTRFFRQTVLVNFLNSFQHNRSIFKHEIFLRNSFSVAGLNRCSPILARRRMARL